MLFFLEISYHFTILLFFSIEVTKINQNQIRYLTPFFVNEILIRVYTLPPAKSPSNPSKQSPLVPHVSTTPPAASFPPPLPQPPPHHRRPSTSDLTSPPFPPPPSHRQGADPVGTTVIQVAAWRSPPLLWLSDLDLERASGWWRTYASTGAGGHPLRGSSHHRASARGRCRRGGARGTTLASSTARPRCGRLVAHPSSPPPRATAHRWVVVLDLWPLVAGLRARRRRHRVLWWDQWNQWRCRRVFGFWLFVPYLQLQWQVSASPLSWHFVFFLCIDKFPSS